MKHLIFILLVTISLTRSDAQQNPDYNKALADSLGADSYGMKMYYFVLLTTGSASVADKDKVSKAFEGHMKNINHMLEAGKLVVAGPFGKNEVNFRGLFILNAKDVEEAELLLSGDPAIREGYLKSEIIPWYGSAALPMYLPYARVISKEQF